MKKLDLSLPVQTREGAKVWICPEFDTDSSFPVVGFVKYPDGSLVYQCWDIEGRYYLESSKKSNHDLVNVPETKNFIYYFIVDNFGDVSFCTEEEVKEKGYHNLDEKNIFAMKKILIECKEGEIDI